MNIVDITDFDAQELDIYARTSEVELLRFNEPKPGVFIAESPKVIERALDAGYEPVSLLADRARLQDAHTISLIERCADIPVYAASEECLTKLTGFKLTGGLLCAMKRRELKELSSLCTGMQRIVILEHVQNPTNIGAIFRSAAALGIDAVVLTDGCSDPLYRRSARVSMGTVFQIPWTIMKKNIVWPEEGLEQLKNMGYTTAAMALREDGISVDDKALSSSKRLAIIMGAEGDGLSDSTIAGCDYTVYIPMKHGVDSLNVAAASAVAFWALGRQSPANR